MDIQLLIRVVYSLMTLYMMVILLRWLGPRLNIDLDRYKWIPMLTDPLINRVRVMLPNLGPVDFSPIVVLLLVWFVRNIAVQVLAGS
jgi:YggT family protein